MIKASRYTTISRLLLTAALLAIGLLSLMPSPPEPPQLISWDKLQHASAYLVLTYLAYHSRLFSVHPFRQILLAGIFSWLYGAFIEAAQMLMPYGRSAEYGDLAANFAGAAVACLLLFCLTPVRHEEMS